MLSGTLYARIIGRQYAGHQEMNHALQYFMHYGPAAFRFELAGELDTEGAHRLERDWLSASSVIGEHALIVDLTFVTGAGKEGCTLLARWYAAGARFVAQSKVSRKMVEAITGRPVSEFTSACTASEDGTWLPFRTSLAA
jgi:hypothetical protein